MKLMEKGSAELLNPLNSYEYWRENVDVFHCSFVVLILYFGSKTIVVGIS